VGRKGGRRGRQIKKGEKKGGNPGKSNIDLGLLFYGLSVRAAKAERKGGERGRGGNFSREGEK